MMDAMRTHDTDYLVIGAGAMGMAFTDALIDHADAHVTLVDRRFTAGGHWQDAYPFVQLHQASLFYGVASTVLGTGAVQRQGPEAGLQQRARRPEIQAYFDAVLHDRFLGSDRVAFLSASEYRPEGADHVVTSRVSGERVRVNVRRRIVDATYLSPTIPATTPPPFGVGDGARVVAVNHLPDVVDTPSEYVIAGSGKTATDAIIWLLLNGVDADRIVWVRPRDPWMLNRALVQPDPTVALGLAADTMTAAADASSLDDLFLRLEDAGVMLRIDPSVTPTMAKAPTLGVWELELLRSIENVVRHGHLRNVERGRLELEDGTTVRVADDAVVVHCAADGLKNPPLVSVWRPEEITVQPVRAGFPCFSAAAIGYVEATRRDDAEKNRLCPPSRFGNSLQQWADMNVRGTRASMALGAEPDIAAWSNTVAINPARIPADHPGSAELDRVRERLAAATAPGLEALTRLMATG
jgi:hypothetical protein